MSHPSSIAQVNAIPSGIHPDFPEWCTYIPERSPVFKFHPQRGNALCALSPCAGILYRYDSEIKQYVEVCRVVGATNCSICNQAFPPSIHWYQNPWSRTRWVHDPDPHLLYLCSHCK